MLKKTFPGNLTGKTPLNQSVPNHGADRNAHPAGELSEVAKGKRREVIAAVEVKTEPTVPTSVNAFYYCPNR
jgi:hypothetical protein